VSPSTEHPAPAADAARDDLRISDLVEQAQRRAVRQMLPLRDVLDDLGARFADAGHELALVGGPVRDALLGRPITDLDLATDARPDRTVKLLRAWGDAHWEIGREFGTIGARRGDVVVEVTTDRSEQYDPASRKPEVRFGDTLTGDLSRRDFTVNAMAVRLPGMTFVDPHDGLGYLSRGRKSGGVGPGVRGGVEQRGRRRHGRCDRLRPGRDR
jgi:poly(A) polymerase